MFKYFQKLFDIERKKRLAAFLLDVCCVGVILYLCGLVLDSPTFRAVKESLNMLSGITNAEELQKATMNSITLFSAFFTFCLKVLFLYEFLFPALLQGRTPGKLVMGLRIVTLNNQNNYLLTLVKYLTRSASKCLCIYIFQSFPFFISVMRILSDSDKRAGHDCTSRTKVIMVRTDKVVAM